MTDTTIAPTTAELVAALRALTADSFIHYRRTPKQVYYCESCGAWCSYAQGALRHADNCPWAPARALLARLEATGASGDEGA